MIKIEGHHIFISFSSKDQALALEYRDALVAKGYQTWISCRNIEPGDDWDSSIRLALQDCAMVLLICTTASASSRHVKGEVEIALAKNRKVVPVVVEQCNIPLSWTTLQWVNQEESPSHTIDLLCARLPQLPGTALRIALDEHAPFERIRSLVLGGPLVTKHGVADNKSKVVRDHVTAEGIVDALIIHDICIGSKPPRADVEAWILLDPKAASFNKELTSSPEFTNAIAALNCLSKEIGIIARARRQTLRAKIVVGRRAIFDRAANELRIAIEKTSAFDLDILSYDRLLEIRPDLKCEPI